MLLSFAGVFLLASMMVAALGAVPAVHATGYTVDEAWCISVGGTWEFGSDCSVSSVTINSGDSLDVPSGVDLLANVVDNGIMTIEGSFLPGTVNNLGTIIVQSSGTLVYGQTFTNYGSVSVGSSAYLGDYLGATFTNYGAFTDKGTFHIDGSFYEECEATFASTPNTGVGTYYPPTGCTTNGVPEFPLGLGLLLAAMVPAMLVLRKISFKNPSASS